MVRLPLCAPQILIYAVGIDPRKLPKVAIMALSTNPKSNNRGPRRPTARLFATTFAPNQIMAICAYPRLDGACRSSGSTRTMPRASRPASASIRAFQLWNLDGTGMRRGAVDEDSKVLFSTELQLVVEMPSAAPDFSRSAGGISLASMMLRVGESVSMLQRTSRTESRCGRKVD